MRCGSCGGRTYEPIDEGGCTCDSDYVLEQLRAAREELNQRDTDQERLDWFSIPMGARCTVGQVDGTWFVLAPNDTEVVSEHPTIREAIDAARAHEVKR